MRSASSSTASWSDSITVNLAIHGPGCAALAILVAGCAFGNSSDGAERGLRGWLEALERRDLDTACELLTDEYRQQLGSSDGEPTPNASECSAAMAGLIEKTDAVAPGDAEIDVPVWDPSGEALVEAKDPSDGAVSKYWMQYEDGKWLVAGQAP